MSENVIKTKSFNFALRIIKLFQFLNQEKKEFVLSKQLLRSGTSIGALVRESEQAESKKILFISWQLHKKKQTKQIIG
jgi:four helix bundle protein